MFPFKARTRSLRKNTTIAIEIGFNLRKKKFCCRLGVSLVSESLSFHRINKKAASDKFSRNAFSQRNTNQTTKTLFFFFIIIVAVVIVFTVKKQKFIYLTKNRCRKISATFHVSGGINKFFLIYDQLFRPYLSYACPLLST